jgi:HAD superfamily hydrolase (TIGR01509 family)
VGGVNASDLDAVTLDAHGTILRVVDPVPRLQELLPGHEPAAVADAFAVEGRFYREHAGRGLDEPSLDRLRAECVDVFNRELGSALSVAEYIDAIRFDVLPGAAEALTRLRRLGLALAVVGNWDVSLHERLAEAGLAGFFATVIHAARKPDPAGLLLALDRLGVRPGRALHVGDEEADEQAARAAGMQFVPAPLSTAVEALA